MKFQVGNRRAVGRLENSPALNISAQIGQFCNFCIETTTGSGSLVRPVIVLSTQGTRIYLTGGSTYLITADNNLVHVQSSVCQQDITFQLQSLVSCFYGRRVILINSGKTFSGQQFQFGKSCLIRILIITGILGHIFISLFDGTHIEPAQRFLQAIHFHCILRQVQITDNLFIQRRFRSYLGYLRGEVGFIIQQVCHFGYDMLLNAGIIGCNQCLHIASTERQECRGFRLIFLHDIRSGFRTRNALQTENHRTCGRTVLQPNLCLETDIFLIQRHNNLCVGICHNRAFVGFALHDNILSLGIPIETQATAASLFECIS